MKVKTGRQTRDYRTVSFDTGRNCVQLIDQTLLPHQFKRVECENYRETAKAIKTMIVRGAGAIGATAAYGFAQGLRSKRFVNLYSFENHVEKVFNTLAHARPTAVDPINAMLHIRSRMNRAGSISDKQDTALHEAESFAEQQIAECKSIGVHGRPLIRNGARILTHCNAGWLAFVDVGTATAPLYAAQAQGVEFKVYCDETRPRSQGATLTAWELHQQGIDHCIIADNAAGHLMQRGEIDLVIVGSDRTLGRTGEVANKIGTYTKAVLAREHRIPFYVAIPFSTLDWELESGMEIPIEERGMDEVLCAEGMGSAKERVKIRVANPGSPARNPSFDVTPASFITGIITPAGIFKPGELRKNRKRLSPSM